MNEQESIVFCVDNSQHSAQGDLAPNRLSAQKQVVESLVRGKLRLNPQNSLGHISMAGNTNVNVASFNSTSDSFAKRLSIIKIQTDCEVRLIHGMMIARLVLRNRPIRTQKPRIVVFVGSPIVQLAKGQSSEEILNVAKGLKKEGIKADFVLFGEAAQDDETKSVIAQFVNLLNRGSDGSSMAIVPTGQTSLHSALASSELFLRNGLGGPIGGNQQDEDDAELQLALALSMQQQ